MTVGVPVGGCCGGAAVAVPVRATVCVLPVDAARVVRRHERRRLRAGGRDRLERHGHRAARARTERRAAGRASRARSSRRPVPVSENFVAASVSGLSPLFVSVNDFVALVVPICWVPNVPFVDGGQRRQRSDRHVAVREPQVLDVAQRVRAVRAGAVGDRDAAVGVLRDRVVRPRSGEHGRVDRAGRGRLGARSRATHSRLPGSTRPANTAC